MQLLKTLFHSTKFSLEDNVLVEFSNYFEDDTGYNGFSLDSADIPALKRFVQLIKRNDCACEIFVCTYGYEFTNSQGQRGTYADMLWLDTSLSISDIEKMIEASGAAEPGDISIIGNSPDLTEGKTWLIAPSEFGKPQITELQNCNKIGNMVCLYWD